ncbi:hypothetical protein PAXRUDRAFT_96879, partial [Paxillus rubicundulus Ve08.2h10]
AHARPLGELVAHYLTAHGYGVSDVDTILQHYSQSMSRDQFVLLLVGEGMAVAEGNFLLDII